MRNCGIFRFLTYSVWSGPLYTVYYDVEAGKWSKIKTIWVTFYCGTGHVLSSVILGFIGIAAGVALEKLEFIEGFRGEIAGWLLITF